MTTRRDPFFTRFELLSENAEVPVRSLLPDSIRTEVIATGLGEHVDGYYAEDHSLRVRTTEYPIENSARLTDRSRTRTRAHLYIGAPRSPGKQSSASPRRSNWSR